MLIFDDFQLLFTRLSRSLNPGEFRPKNYHLQAQ